MGCCTSECLLFQLHDLSALCSVELTFRLDDLECRLVVLTGEGNILGLEPVDLDKQFLLLGQQRLDLRLELGYFGLDFAAGAGQALEEGIGF